MPRVNSYNAQKRANLSLWLCGLMLSPLLTAPVAAGAQQAGLAEQLHLGGEAMRAGEPEKAIVYFQSAAALAPRMAEVQMNLGLAEEQAGHQKEAADAFSKAITLKPTLPGVNLFLGIADYRLNRLDGAVKALSAEAARNPNSSKALMWLGVTYLAENKPEQAAKALDRAAVLDPTNVDVMYHRGRAHLLISKNAYEAIFRANPNHWRVHQVLAESYAEADRDADAIREYRLAIEGAPTEPGLHDRLGTELWRTGNLDEADKALAEELQLDPDSLTALYHLGRLRVTRADHGQIADGIALLKRALAQDPSMSQVEYYLGRGTAQLGDNAEALTHFENAIRADPGGPGAQQAYFQMAHLYRLMKRPDDARVALANFTRLRQLADADSKQKLQNRMARNAELTENDTAAP